jgi:Mn-dependent DtxR family transcriptional regulator
MAIQAAEETAAMLGTGPSSASEMETELPFGGDVDAMLEASYNDILRSAVAETRATVHSECERALDNLLGMDMDSACEDLKTVSARGKETRTLTWA